MAKKLERATTDVKLMPKSEAIKLDKWLTGRETELSETRGAMGNAMTQAAAKWGANSPAFKIARRYMRKPAAQAAEFYTQLQYFWEVFGVGEVPATKPAPKRRGRPPKAKPTEERPLAEVAPLRVA